MAVPYSVIKAPKPTTGGKDSIKGPRATDSWAGGYSAIVSDQLEIILRLSKRTRVGQVQLVNNGAAMFELLGLNLPIEDDEEDDSKFLLGVDMEKAKQLLVPMNLMLFSEWNGIQKNSAAWSVATSKYDTIGSKEYIYSQKDKLSSTLDSFNVLILRLRGYSHTTQAFGIEYFGIYAAPKSGVRFAPEPAGPKVSALPAAAKSAAATLAQASPAGKVTVSTSTGQTLSLELEDDEEDPGDLMATPKKSTAPEPKADSPVTPPVASTFKYDQSKFEKVKKAAEASEEAKKAVKPLPYAKTSKAPNKLDTPENTPEVDKKSAPKSSAASPAKKPTPAAKKTPPAAKKTAPAAKKSASKMEVDEEEQAEEKKPTRAAKSAAAKPKEETDDTAANVPFNQILSGITVVVSGIGDPERTKIKTLVHKMGGTYSHPWPAKGTRVLLHDAEALEAMDGPGASDTPKYRSAKEDKAPVVKKSWLYDSEKAKQKLPFSAKYTIKLKQDKVDSTSPPKKPKKKKSASEESDSGGENEWDYGDGFVVKDEDYDEETDSVRRKVAPRAVNKNKGKYIDNEDGENPFDVDYQEEKEEKSGKEGKKRKQPDDDDVIDDEEIEGLKPPAKKAKKAAATPKAKGKAEPKEKEDKFKQWQKFILGLPGNGASVGMDVDE